MTAFSLCYLLVILFHFSTAMQHTVPVVAWTSHHSQKLTSLATTKSIFAHQSHLFEQLLEGDELCSYDLVIVVQQPELHASDLKTLSPESSLNQHLESSPSSLQIPFLPYNHHTPTSHELSPIRHFAQDIESRCGSRSVTVGLLQGGVTISPDEKYVVSLVMPSLPEVGRKTKMQQLAEQLMDDISNLSSNSRSIFAVYVGSTPVVKRQSPPDSTGDEVSTRPSWSPSVEKVSFAVAPNSTLADGGLLQRYQFFTPGLIVAFLIVFGIFVPLLFLGVNALASIQSSIRMSQFKGPSTEKKNQ